MNRVYIISNYSACTYVSLPLLPLCCCYYYYCCQCPTFALLLFAHAIQLAFMQKSISPNGSMMIYAHLIACIDENKVFIDLIWFDSISISFIIVVESNVRFLTNSIYSRACIPAFLFAHTLSLCHCDCCCYCYHHQQQQQQQADRQTQCVPVLLLSPFWPILSHTRSIHSFFGTMVCVI